MLPIYRAIQKISSLEGGTTKPWKVIVLEENTPVPYVVKFFNTKDIEEAHHVAHEVFSNALVKHLDLSCPDAALIVLDEAFIETLSEEDRLFLASKDERVKFGSKFIEGSVPYNSAAPRYTFERYEVEHIYAFDNLVFNVDRRVLKPNILLQDNGYYLIDHELSLPINLKIIQNLNKGVSFYEFKNHIFYKYLKSAKHENRINYFESFEEILRYSRPRETLLPLKNQLVSLRHPVGDFDTLIEYLTLVKQNPTIFTGILKAQMR